MKRTDEEVIAIGDFCKDLLSSDTFDALYKEFKAEHFDLMLSTEPHEVKKREAIYAEMNALGEFMRLMDRYSLQRDTIIEARQSIADDSDDE